MAEMGLDCLARDLANRDSTTRSLMAQAGIELVRQLHRGAFHRMPAYYYYVPLTGGVGREDRRCRRSVDARTDAQLLQLRALWEKDLPVPAIK